jgi:hypothetical protein
MIRFPYRWRLRTVSRNLSHAWSDIRNGVRNLWTFRTAVWWYRSFDYSGLLELMEVALREMRNGHRDHGNTVNAQKIARQLTIAMELCRRLREDEYLDHSRWHKWSEDKRTRMVRHSMEQAKKDALYFGRVFRFVQHWWD